MRGYTVLLLLSARFKVQRAQSTALSSASKFAMLLVVMSPALSLSANEESLYELNVSEMPYLTAESAIVLAYLRSPVLSKAFSQIKKGEAQKAEAQGAYYPQLNLSSNYGQRGEYVYGPKLKQLIYDFGKTSGSIENQKYLTDSYREDLMKAITDVTGDTLLAYSSVKRYQETILIAQKMIASLENVKDIAQMRLSAGLSSSSDALQASTRIAALYTTLEQYRSQLNNAKSNLAQLTGKRVSSLGDLPSELLREPPLDPNNIDYGSVPSVRSAMAQVKATEAVLGATKAQHMPSISFEASRIHQYQRNLNSSNPAWDNQFGVSMEIPLYKGGSVNARVLQAHEAFTSSKANFHQAWLDAEQKTTTALSNWNGAESRLRSSVNQVDIANRTRDIYRDEYKLGDRSLNDLLGVEQDVFQALSNNTAAKYDRYDAAISYNVVQNTLLPLLGVDSPSERELPNL